MVTTSVFPEVTCRTAGKGWNFVLQKHSSLEILVMYACMHAFYLCSPWTVYLGFWKTSFQLVQIKGSKNRVLCTARCLFTHYNWDCCFHRRYLAVRAVRELAAHGLQLQKLSCSTRLWSWPWRERKSPKGILGSFRREQSSACKHSLPVQVGRRINFQYTPWLDDSSFPSVPSAAAELMGMMVMGWYMWILRYC